MLGPAALDQVGRSYHPAVPPPMDDDRARRPLALSRAMRAINDLAGPRIWSASRHAGRLRRHARSRTIVFHPRTPLALPRPEAQPDPLRRHGACDRHAAGLVPLCSRHHRNRASRGSPRPDRRRGRAALAARPSCFGPAAGAAGSCRRETKTGSVSSLGVSVSLGWVTGRPVQ